MRLASYVCFYYVIIDWCQTHDNNRILLKVLMVSTIAVAIFGLWQALTGGYAALYDLLYPVQDEIAQIPALPDTSIWSFRSVWFLPLAVPTMFFGGLADGVVRLRLLRFCFRKVAVV